MDNVLRLVQIEEYVLRAYGAGRDQWGPMMLMAPKDNQAGDGPDSQNRTHVARGCSLENEQSVRKACSGIKLTIILEVL